MNPPRHVPVSAAHDVPATCVAAEAYALRVTNNDLAPEFPLGCVITVDPGLAPRTGAYAIAQLDEGATLGELCLHDGQWHLHPRGAHNAGYRLLATQIMGIVTQRAGRRRRDHKRYD